MLKNAISDPAHVSSSPEIVQNFETSLVFHSEFDNSDKLVNKLYTRSISNFADGMSQDLESDEILETKIDLLITQILSTTSFNANAININTWKTRLTDQ